ncbi:GATS protein-like 3 [Actinomortierella ambigua]|nr:GATS protein-like 3 [Actinomortierella ambigua]
MTVTDDVFCAFLVEDIEGIDNSGRRINELSALLSRNGVSIFYLSTYQADFILCKEKRLELVLPTIRSIFALYFDSDCESSIAAAHGRQGSISGQSDIMGSFPGSSFTSINSFLHTPSSPARYAPHFQYYHPSQPADRYSFSTTTSSSTHPFAQIHAIPQSPLSAAAHPPPSSHYPYPAWSSGSTTSSGMTAAAVPGATGTAAYLGSSIGSSYTRPSVGISIPFGRRESLTWGGFSSAAAGASTAAGAGAGAGYHHNPHPRRARRQHSESESSTTGDGLSQGGFSVQSNASQFMFSYRSNQGRQNSITSSFGDSGIGRYYPTRHHPHGSSSIDSLESTAVIGPSGPIPMNGGRRRRESRPGLSNGHGGGGGGLIDRGSESAGSSSGDVFSHHSHGRRSPLSVGSGGGGGENRGGSTTPARTTSDNSINMFPLTDIREETSASSSITNTAENSSTMTRATTTTTIAAPTSISTGSTAILSSEEEGGGGGTRSPYPWSATGGSMPPFSFLSASSLSLMNETQEELEDREAKIKAKVRQTCPRAVMDEKLVLAGLSMDYEDQWAVPLLKVLFYPETLSGLPQQKSRFVSLTVTDDGISLVADESIQDYFEDYTLNMSLSESKTLRCIQVDLSTFGLDTYGLVYSMSNSLVDVGINMLCLSTYGTANILVNDADLQRSIEILGLKEPVAVAETMAKKTMMATTTTTTTDTSGTLPTKPLSALSSTLGASLLFDVDEDGGEEDLDSEDEEDETSSYTSSVDTSSPEESSPSSPEAPTSVM